MGAAIHAQGRPQMFFTGGLKICAFAVHSLFSSLIHHKLIVPTAEYQTEAC